MRLFARIYEYLIYVLLIILLCTVAVLEVPKIFGLTPFIVLSGSMEPKIPVGAVAYTNTHDKDVKVGDIISYKIYGVDQYEDDIMVLHRIIGQREDGSWITKGDANEIEDGVIVTDEHIVGTYSYCIPEIGKLLSKITTKGRLVIFIWTIALVIMSFVFDYIATIMEEGNEEDDDEEEERAPVRKKAPRRRKKRVKRLAEDVS